ncbi:unnamed protein product [Laminaria digitata]
MELAGPTVGKATARPFRALINHRRLVATIFSRSITAAMKDAPAAVVVEDEEEEMFHCVASQGMLSSVLALIADERFSYDLPDRFGRTPLHWAAEQGHRNVVLALLRAGASVDPRSQRKATPIMLAASRGHVKNVGVLLRYHAGRSDCRPLNRHRRGIVHWRSTALHCAAAGGHVRVVEILLDAGFDMEQHDGAGLTPAEVSARQSHSTSPAMTHLLLPICDMGGKLVHDYVNMVVQDVAMISGLVKGGAFLDWRNETGDTPLHRAAHFQHITISRILLQAGADPNLRNHSGASPLHVAACTGRGEVVADLLEAGAGMEHRDTIHGQTPLSKACQGCFAPIVRVLVEVGADVESRSSAGMTPLHWACRLNDAESVDVLLNAGADPGAVDQAAAKDAVPKSSSRSGTRVSMPVAIDVIGLGYPLDRMEESRQPSMASVGRRLHLVSVRRIESALRGAQQERSWRRRGWLVILANRRAPVEKVGATGELWAVGRCGCSPVRSKSMQSRCVDTIAESPPCYARQREAATDLVDSSTNNDSSDSIHVQAEWNDGPSIVNKRLRGVDNVVMVVRAMSSRQQGQTCGYNGAQESVAAPLKDLVGALFGLAAVEVGVFRLVVMFI